MQFSKLAICFAFLFACAPTRPAVNEPTLPSADHMREWWRDGHARTAKVDLCVDANGDVRSATLARSSGDQTYDAAVVQDVRHWSHATRAVDACERASVTYVP